MFLNCSSECVKPPTQFPTCIADKNVLDNPYRVTKRCLGTTTAPSHYLWALSSLSLTWISPSSCSSRGPSQGKVRSASSERTVSAGNLANKITQTCLLMLAHWTAPKFGTLARSMRRSVASPTPRELKAEEFICLASTAEPSTAELWSPKPRSSKALKFLQLLALASPSHGTLSAVALIISTLYPD